jgi:hypothetical protein
MRLSAGSASRTGPPSASGGGLSRSFLPVSLERGEQPENPAQFEQRIPAEAGNYGGGGRLVALLLVKVGIELLDQFEDDPDSPGGIEIVVHGLLETPLEVEE